MPSLTDLLGAQLIRKQFASKKKRNSPGPQYLMVYLKSWTKTPSSNEPSVHIFPQHLPGAPVVPPQVFGPGTHPSPTEPQVRYLEL